jgi:2-dehydro-3-deoxyphosphogluconate aldolase/(4S)-4-hydroxy-2-oxoglutarate aldolase
VKIREILCISPVIPVLTVERVEHAVPLARALVAGGLRVLEVTLRTPVALEAMATMVREVPEAVVGAGTVVRPADLEAVEKVGARFAVSPGLTLPLLKAARGSSVPLLPGVMTPSEAMAAADSGFDTLKLFPAAVAGGISFLRALSGPLPDLAFCPTGGIGPDDFREYLELDSVLCVGGSWVAPKKAVAAKDWAHITRLAQEATA